MFSLMTRIRAFQSFVNSAFAHLAAHQSLNISGLLLSNNIGQIFGELNELIVLGNKVGLSVDFNNNSTVSGGNSVNHAFSSDTASLLSGSSQTLFTQNLDSLVDVAISLDKSLLHSIMPQSVWRRSSITSFAETAMFIRPF